MEKRPVDATAVPTVESPSPASSPSPTPSPKTLPITAERPANRTSSIEADTNPNDTASDAGYESDTASRASTSICTTVRDYAFENSRRYHKFQEGRYVFPNDELEQEREDMKHAMIIHVCSGKLHLAPLDKPQNILDLGTGTGIWAIDMGDEYPEADILGIDLSPIQPPWVPPNVRFMVDDVEAPWVSPPESLDYIHIRHMTSSIRDWPALLSQAYQALKPGGWIEIQDLRFEMGCDDGTMREDNQVAQFLDNVKKGLAAFNVDLLSVRHNKNKVVDANFVNVMEQVFKIPLGVWPKDQNLKTVGLYNRSIIYDALHGVSMKPFIHGLGWTVPEVEIYLIGVRKDLMDASQHGYIPFHVITGQKPLS